MTREEFAIAMCYPVDSLPQLPTFPEIGWQKIYDNACNECKAFNLSGVFPSVHRPECSHSRHIHRGGECHETR